MYGFCLRQQGPWWNKGGGWFKWIRRRKQEKVASLAAKSGVRARPGSESALPVVNFVGGTGPVGETVFSFEDGGERGMRIVLGARHDGMRGDAPQCFYHQRGAGFGETRGEVRGSFVFADEQLLLQQNFAGVHAGVDAHGGVAGDSFAVGDSPVNRGSAAVFREQGSVQVEPAEFWDVQKPRGNDLTVGDDDDGVRSERAEVRFDFRCADFFRLMNGEIGRERDFFNRRKNYLLGAAFGAVGLGVDGEDFELGMAQKMGEGWRGELRGAAEDEAKARGRGHLCSLRARSCRVQGVKKRRIEARVRIKNLRHEVPEVLRKLPIALFAEFFDFAADQIALEHAEMSEEKNA